MKHALPLQFPVQAKHSWMYELDMPLPFPVRHTLFDASNRYDLGLSDLEMMGDMAEQYVDNNNTLNKCMIVRRAISHMDLSESLVSCRYNSDEFPARKLLQKSILYICAEDVLNSDWMPGVTSSAKKALRLIDMGNKNRHLYAQKFQDSICMNEYYDVDLCHLLEQQSKTVQLVACCMSEMARDGQLRDTMTVLS